MKRIAIILASLVTTVLLPVAPAIADDARPEVPAECTPYTSPMAARAEGMIQELKAIYRERDEYRVFFIEQRDRAEAFKAQVARKDATIARLREQLAAARR